MKGYAINLLIFLIIISVLCGCVSNTPDPMGYQKVPSEQPPDQLIQDGGGLNTNGAAFPDSPDSHNNLRGSEKPENIVSESSPEPSKDLSMKEFIESSFPAVTELYVGIKKSRNALAWKEVQDKALQLQLLIQDYKKTYRLDAPNPEKKVFGKLDSREEIILLKYLQYLDDIEGYAVNLKNAVYYQDKGSDSESTQTAMRYQSHADQYLKRAIAEVKTINDYCNDFKYTFFDSKLVFEYRYIN